MLSALLVAVALQSNSEIEARQSAPNSQAPVFAMGYMDVPRVSEDARAFPGVVGFFVKAPYHCFEKRGQYTVRVVRQLGVARSTRSHKFGMSQCIFETTDGKKLTPDAAAKKFEQQHPAILLTMEEKLDPFYAKILEGRVIVVRTRDRFVRVLPLPPKKKETTRPK